MPPALQAPAPAAAAAAGDEAGVTVLSFSFFLEAFFTFFSSVAGVDASFSFFPAFALTLPSFSFSVLVGDDAGDEDVTADAAVAAAAAAAAAAFSFFVGCFRGFFAFLSDEEAGADEEDGEEVPVALVLTLESGQRIIVSVDEADEREGEEGIFFLAVTVVADAVFAVGFFFVGFLGAFSLPLFPLTLLLPLLLA